MRILLWQSLLYQASVVLIFPGSFSNLSPLPDSPRTVADIPLPAGFHRLDTSSRSFAGWLEVSIRSDRTVYLYNGLPKVNRLPNMPCWTFPLEHRICSNVPMP